MNKDKLLEILGNLEKRESFLKCASKQDLQEFHKYLKEIDDVDLSNEPDWDKSLVAIKQSKRVNSYFRRHIYTILKYAASILVIFTLSYITYSILNLNMHKSQISYKNTPIQARQNKAQLILSDGAIIDLTDNKIGDEIQDNIALIKKDSNSLLSYETKDVKETKLKYNTIIIPRGAEYSLELSDGTKIHLNSDSELRYPIYFSGKQRKVFLKGEGYFKVKRNENMPFHVEVSNMDVEVLGTTFNINSYEENAAIRTTLVEGSVKVSDKENTTKTAILKPNQQAVFNDEGITINKVDVNQYVSWVSGKFYFKYMTLEKVMIQIERWYDVQVFFSSKDARSRLFAGVIDKAYSLDEILKIIEDVTKVKIRRKEKSIYIE